MSRVRRSYVFGLIIVLVFSAGTSQVGSAQASSSQQSWTTSSQLTDPNGTVNPTRSTVTHSEVDGRVVEKTVTEALGPDGRYLPYAEIEKETVRVNETTVRTVERSFGRTPDGQRVLTQETQEESRSFPGGETKVTRTISNPDGNGGMQVVQRALIDSKQVSPAIRETKTTVFSGDGSGGLGPSVQIEEREKKVDANTVEFTKSTSLADGTGRWVLSELREGVRKQAADGGITKEENVLRPDSNGTMALMERTVSRQSGISGGQSSGTGETYSTSVPGQAGSEGLQLVRRESTIQRTNVSGARSTTRQVEQTNPGDPGAGLRVTQEAIDIVRPGANGTASQRSTILTSDSNGNFNTVWVDMEKTDNSDVVRVDTSQQAKAKEK